MKKLDTLNVIQAIVFVFIVVSCDIVKNIDPIIYKGDISTLKKESVNLSSMESSNCYIVSEPGIYSFATVKGNSTEAIGPVVSAHVLWESAGTSRQPSKGSILQGALYDDGMIYFKTAASYCEGNSVIVAKDVLGKILWSWHIWLTDQPEELLYSNDAGIIMDRNLGATSANSDDVASLGLLYQWGRKDPFLGSSSINANLLAQSTMVWPRPVPSNSSIGTIDYAISHPTEFITQNTNNYDWYYSINSSTDNTRWTTSDMRKSVYDPCPGGWRVPDGGSRSVWKKANIMPVDTTAADHGFFFTCSQQSSSWYPFTGSRSSKDGGSTLVGRNGYYWTASSSGNHAYALNFGYDGNINILYSSYRAFAFAVRCQKE